MPPFVLPSPDDVAQCLTTKPLTIQTRFGAVEYARRGHGPVILSLHGGPGGFDQGLVLAEPFRANGYSVVAPSRPGYLGTPLESGASLDEQADLAVALLDALEIESAIVIGASAGGPPSYKVATRHPDRVRALIVIDGVCLNYTAEHASKLEQAFYLSKPGTWLMAKLMEHFPEAMARTLLDTESTLDKQTIAEHAKTMAKDPLRLEYMSAMVATMTTNFKQRTHGTDNDMEQLGRIDAMDLSGVSAPTCIVHGTADRDVPVKHAEHAIKNIPGADAIWVQDGSHLGFWAEEDAARAQEQAVLWLEKSLMD